MIVAGWMKTRLQSIFARGAVPGKFICRLCLRGKKLLDFIFRQRWLAGCLGSAWDSHENPFCNCADHTKYEKHVRTGFEDRIIVRGMRYAVWDEDIYNE